MVKRTSHLTKLDQISVGEREKEREERERSSTFSLDLTTIGPLAFVGARDKVRPRGESLE